MKAVGLFFRVVLWLLVLSAGMALLIVAFSPESYRELFAQSMAQKAYSAFLAPVYLRFWPGLVLVVLALLAALPALCVPAKTSVIAFTTAEGPVEISLGAVKDFVNRLCKGVPGVREVTDVRVVQRAAGVAVRIRVSLGQGARVPEITKRCQERVRQDLGTTLGVEQIHQVAVLVDGVEPSAEPYSPPEPFRAPSSSFEAAEQEDKDEEYRP